MIPTLDEITLSEQKDTTALGEALSLLMTRWQAGARDEETAIRLLFLCWYSVVEPPYLTGLPESNSLFAEIFEQAGGEENATPLVLLAVGVMAGMFSWAIGDEAAWAEQAERLERKAKELQPDIGGSSFSGLGEAGRYFRHVLKPQKLKSPEQEQECRDAEERRHLLELHNEDCLGMAKEGSVSCLYCGDASHIRFFDKRPKRCYFICGVCGRSFGSSKTT